MKIESTVKVKHDYVDDLKTFKPSDVFCIPFDSVAICIDNGEFEGPWINLVNHETEDEFIVQFESPDFSVNSNKDKEAKAFFKTIANILRKNQVPIKFEVDRYCMEASIKRVAA